MTSQPAAPCPRSPWRVWAGCCWALLAGLCPPAAPQADGAGAPATAAEAGDPDDPELWRYEEDVHSRIWLDKPPIDPADLLARPEAWEDVLASHGLALDVEERTVHLRGATIMDPRMVADPIEYLVVTEAGKTHEALFLVRAQPSILDACLRAMGLSPGAHTRVEEKDPLPPQEEIDKGRVSPWLVTAPHGPLIDVTVTWVDDFGQSREAGLERTLLDMRTWEALPVRGWIYTGSRFGTYRIGRDEKRWFKADVEGDIVAIYLAGRDSCLFERNSLDGLEDSYYYPNPENLPPRHTPVTIRFAARDEAVAATPPQEGPTLEPLPPEDFFFESDGVSIRFIDEGPRDGEPVVLIHGGLTDLESWVAPGVVAALDDAYRVIALDLRGHGRSGKPHEPSAYGGAMAEDVVRLLDHLGIGRAHVVGYSMGGRITYKLVADHPERLLSALPCGTDGEPPGEGLRAALARAATSLEESGSARPIIEYFNSDGSMTEAEVEQIVESLRLSNDARAMAAVLRSFPDLLPDRSKLEANRIPSVCIIGEHDENRPAAERTAGFMQGLEIRVVAGADHMTAVAAPAFVEELRSFLDAHRVQPAPGD